MMLHCELRKAMQKLNKVMNKGTCRFLALVCLFEIAVVWKFIELEIQITRAADVRHLCVFTF